MDWLDEVAENLKNEKDSIEAYQNKVKKINEKYPQMVDQVWNLFEEPLIILKSKGVKSLEIKKNNDKYFEFQTDDLKFEARAERDEYFGGFYGSISFRFNNKNTLLPVETILLKDDKEELLWVYKDSQTHGIYPKYRPFTSEDVEAILKKVFERYLK